MTDPEIARRDAYIHVLEQELADAREELVGLRDDHSKLRRLVYPERKRVFLTHGRVGGDCIYIAGEDARPGEEEFLTLRVNDCYVEDLGNDHICIYERQPYGDHTEIMYICSLMGYESCYISNLKLYVDYESGLSVLQVLMDR